MILKTSTDVANQGDYDLLLVGLEINFEGTLLGKVVGLQQIINQIAC
jgi:hypothetical protein